MFRSILCIREPLNHAATNTSIDINLCMVEVSQRQAELLLLRKMIFVLLKLFVVVVVFFLQILKAQLHDFDNFYGFRVFV